MKMMGKKLCTGPLPELSDERNMDEEKTLTVESIYVIPMGGMPVVVHTGYFQELVEEAAVWFNKPISKWQVETSKAAVGPTIAIANVISLAMVAYAIVSFFTGGRGLFTAMCFELVGLQLFFEFNEVKNAVKNDYLNGKIGYTRAFSKDK